jgi:hypothetical protein
VFNPKILSCLFPRQVFSWHCTPLRRDVSSISQKYCQAIASTLTRLIEKVGHRSFGRQSRALDSNWDTDLGIDVGLCHLPVEEVLIDSKTAIPGYRNVENTHYRLLSRRNSSVECR